jgi:hypothetical protein
MPRPYPALCFENLLRVFEIPAAALDEAPVVPKDYSICFWRSGKGWRYTSPYICAIV